MLASSGATVSMCSASTSTGHEAQLDLLVHITRMFASVVMLSTRSMGNDGSIGASEKRTGGAGVSAVPLEAVSLEPASSLLYLRVCS